MLLLPYTLPLIEPMQALLEPLAEGIRLSFMNGNVEGSYVCTIYYLVRSFHCGKNISVLHGELDALSRQHGNIIGGDHSTSKPQAYQYLQFYFTLLHNTLNGLKGEDLKTSDQQGSEEEPLYPPVNNDHLMKSALESENLSCLHTVLTYTTVTSFMNQDLHKALECRNLYWENFTGSFLYTEIYSVFYEALISYRFKRETGKGCPDFV